MYLFTVFKLSTQSRVLWKGLECSEHLSLSICWLTCTALWYSDPCTVTSRVLIHLSEATDQDWSEASGDPETAEKAGDVSGAIVPTSGPLHCTLRQLSSTGSALASSEIFLAPSGAQGVTMSVSMSVRCKFVTTGLSQGSLTYFIVVQAEPKYFVLFVPSGAQGFIL